LFTSLGDGEGVLIPALRGVTVCSKPSRSPSPRAIEDLPAARHVLTTLKINHSSRTERFEHRLNAGFSTHQMIVSGFRQPPLLRRR
jgi:hypothetical protein